MIGTARTTAVVAALLLCAAADGARAQEQEQAAEPTGPQSYVQAWLGTVDGNEAWSSDDNLQLEGDNSDLILGGGVGQRLWGATGQYGFEGGALVSFVNDKVEFAGADPGLSVTIDNELFLGEVFMGGVVSARPVRWLRLYAAAGPSIAWGLLYGDGSDDDADGDGLVVVGPGSLLVVDLDETRSDFSFGAYARVGVNFELDNGFTFGISARYADHKLDFNERGALELDEVQWFLTLGARI